MNSTVVTRLDIADRHIQDYPRATASQADDLPLCAKADVQRGGPGDLLDTSDPRTNMGLLE